MADMIKVPGVGPVKKIYVIAGVGVLGGVLVYAYWKRSTAPADTSTATDTSAYDASSGYVQDSTAAGYNTVYPSAYSDAYSPYGYDIYGNPLPAPTGAGSGGVYTTNSDWAAAAESALETGGVSLSVSGMAISRVLGGLSVTSDQRDIFMQAVGLLGQPPQGYPTPIHLVDSGTGPSPAPSGGPLPAPTGLKATTIGASTATLTWKPVAGAVKYAVFHNHASGSVASTTATTVVVHGLAHNTTYLFHVDAVDASGQTGAPSAHITVRTKK